MAFSGKLTAANHADVLAKITAFITGDPAGPRLDRRAPRRPRMGPGHGLSEYKPFRDRRGLCRAVRGHVYRQRERRPRM